MIKSYKELKDFKKKHPLTIAWRIKSHAKIIDKHLDEKEKIYYAFVGQKNDNMLDIISTTAFVLTNKRIMLASKRLLFGYKFKSITPDMYNDITVGKSILFGRVVIDTMKEVVVFTNIAPSALDEIETKITEYMIAYKKHFGIREEKVK